jgi:hypothetical protein
MQRSRKLFVVQRRGQMSPEDFVILCDQFERAYLYWRMLRKDKAQPWVIDEALERVNRLCDDVSDAIVMAHTGPKLTAKQRKAQEAADAA